MEQRISVITLGVADLSRARRFYEALGWTASAASSPNITVFNLGWMLVCLFPRGELAADAGLDDAGEIARFGGITLAYNAASKDLVNMVMAQAEDAGATITKPAMDAFWGGYSGAFRDPDGHVWEVAWNPHWFAADGSVILTD